MRVMGVDPGSRTTGYGVLDKKGSVVDCVDYGQVSPPVTAPLHERIHHIYRAVGEVMHRHRPDQLAIEDIFYAKNAQSSLKLGHARGAILIAAVECGIAVFEYSPLEIKNAVVGYGRAGKDQVRSMVQRILGLGPDLRLDASDALATAICHANWSRIPGGTGRPRRAGRGNRRRTAPPAPKGDRGRAGIS